VIQAAFYTVSVYKPGPETLHVRNAALTNAKWYSKRRTAEFSFRPNLRIMVREYRFCDALYVEKLGLRKLAASSSSEPSAAIFRFKADGNSVILTTPRAASKLADSILFAKKINRMRDVMSATCVDVGAIELDRQGIHYFKIHDPKETRLRSLRNAETGYADEASAASAGLCTAPCIEPLGPTITDAAAALGVTRTTLSELVNEKRGISPEMAVRLSKVFGGSAASCWCSRRITISPKFALTESNSIVCRRFETGGEDSRRSQWYMRRQLWPEWLRFSVFFIIPA